MCLGLFYFLDRSFAKLDKILQPNLPKNFGSSGERRDGLGFVALCGVNFADIVPKPGSIVFYTK
jgi:hypothetical protein